MAAASPSRRRQGPVGGGWIALLLALVPLVTAAVRAIRSGRVPVGDAALIAVRSHDVLGGGRAAADRHVVGQVDGDRGPHGGR
jgi:hypothetical protein